MNIGFTERDVHNAERYVDALAKSGAQYARMGKVSVETLEQERDTLEIGGAYIMQHESQTTGLVPRPCIKYSVQIPYTTHGGYWEPDETDYHEIATTDSLFEAILNLYLQLADQYCRDVAMATAYELDNEVLEEA
jgi:hypothetical protein